MLQVSLLSEPGRGLRRILHSIAALVFGAALVGCGVDSVSTARDDRVSHYLRVQYSHTEMSSAAATCFDTFGVRDVLDSLVDPPIITARVTRMARSELDKLIACLRGTGADVVTLPDLGPLIHA